MTTLFILTRTVHFGACLLFFGVFAFDCFIAAVLPRRQSAVAGYLRFCRRFFGLILLPLIFISGITWFALVTRAISEQPLQIDILKTVWTQTQFGTVWKIRLIFLLAATTAAALDYFLKSETLQRFVVWLQLFVNGCLVGSLAWVGHGQESSPWHLFADILHLLAAGLWPAGLLPLFLLLHHFRQLTNASDWLSMAVLVRRFSVASISAVSLLAATGFVNGWFLVGSVSNLFGQSYGRWLLVKVIFFCVALAVASVNLVRLKPRLLTESSSPEKATVTAGQLRTNIQLELLLGLAIIVVVAILGILPPAIQ